MKLILDKQRVVICILGEISEATVEDFKNLDDILEIVVFLNSAGGHLESSQKIYELLKKTPARKIAICGPYVASGATLVLCGCDFIIAPKNGALVLHSPKTSIQGVAPERLRELADRLDEARFFMITAYGEKLKSLPAENIRQLMDEAAWITSSEAKDLGFIDELSETACCCPPRGADQKTLREVLSVPDRTAWSR